MVFSGGPELGRLKRSYFSVRGQVRRYISRVPVFPSDEEKGTRGTRSIPEPCQRVMFRYDALHRREVNPPLPRV